jgi:hypothetical protein
VLILVVLVVLAGLVALEEFAVLVEIVVFVDARIVVLVRTLTVLESVVAAEGIRYVGALWLTSSGSSYGDSSRGDYKQYVEAVVCMQYKERR